MAAEHDKRHVGVILKWPSLSMRKVYTLEDKRIGMIKRDQFKILYSVQARTLTNEEFRIPISAISAVESHGYQPKPEGRAVEARATSSLKASPTRNMQLEL